MDILQKNFIYKENKLITLQELKNLVNELLNVEWDIRTNKGDMKISLKDWDFRFNNTKRAIGRTNKKLRVIELSTKFWEVNQDKARDWEDTIRHEIAHAIDIEIRGGSRHDSIWRNIAIQVCADPRATTSKFTAPRRKYTLICPKCGHSVQLERKSYREYACPYCCKKYNNNKWSEEYKMIYKLN